MSILDDAKKNKARVSYSLPFAMILRVEALAEENEVKFSTMAEHLIDLGLKEHEKKPVKKAGK